MKRMFLMLMIIGLALFASPVYGAINTVAAGGTVFIGEQGLDITAGTGANDQIAWFPATAETTSATPEQVIDVTTIKTGFYVSPTYFSSRTGNWYSWNSGLTVGTAAVAFRVDDPRLTIKVDDMDAGVDVTNKWLYRGDEAGFRIETNLYPVGQRAGMTGAPITIKFQTPDGAVLTALTNKAGTSNLLTDIPVATSPYTTGRFWDSSNSRYSTGTYTIWAESNPNGMMDNYPQEGKTTSSKVTVLVTDINPLIKQPATSVAAIVPETKVTARTTTQHATTATTHAGRTISLPETTPPGQPTKREAGVVQTETVPTPARTYADGFTALVSVAACCASAVLLNSRFR